MAQIARFDDTIISFMRQHGAEKVAVFGSYAQMKAVPKAYGHVQRAASLLGVNRRV